jgi:hypothetical protein
MLRLLRRPPNRIDAQVRNRDSVVGLLLRHDAIVLQSMTSRCLVRVGSGPPRPVCTVPHPWRVGSADQTRASRRACGMTSPRCYGHPAPSACRAVKLDRPLDDQVPVLVSEAGVVPFVTTRSFVVITTTTDSDPTHLGVLIAHGCGDHAALGVVMNGPCDPRRPGRVAARAWSPAAVRFVQGLTGLPASEKRVKASG